MFQTSGFNFEAFYQALTRPGLRRIPSEVSGRANCFRMSTIEPACSNRRRALLQAVAEGHQSPST